jgi:beta-lactamase superfamily II metal-dependent hydrolase
MHFIIWCSRAAAHLPGGVWNVAAPSPALCLFYYLTLLLAVTGRLWRSRWKWAAWPALACLGVFCVVQSARDHRIARLHLLPLNGSVAVFAGAPAIGAGLLDCGNGLSANEILKPFLCAQGVNRLDSFDLTVGRTEHFGGAEVILGNFGISSVYAAADSSRSANFRQLLDKLRQSGRLRPAKDGTDAGGWSVLHPRAEDQFTQADDGSLALRGEFYGHSVLLLPSLGREGQDALIRRHADLRAEMVVAGLPVRDEPVCDPLLDMLQARTVVIADGRFPANRRASEKLRQRLARHACKVLYCRDTGALTIEIAPDGRVRIHNSEIDF